MTERLRGIVIPTILPLDGSGNPDAASLSRLIERAINSGIRGCWINGTSGGFHHASDEHRARAITIAVEACGGRIPIIAHIGDTSLARACARAREARELGAEFIAAITPYYLELERDELEDHHRRIADAFGGPIFMYQHPATGDQGLSNESILRLAEDGVVRGIKESGSDLDGFESLCTAVANSDVDFVCMHGAGGIAIESLSRGGDGLVTVAANLLPRTMAALFDAFDGGAMEDAHRHQEVVVEVTNAIKASIPDRTTPGSAVIATTWILKELGIFGTDDVFAPLRKLEQREKDSLRQTVIPIVESAETGGSTSIGPDT